MERLPRNSQAQRNKKKLKEAENIKKKKKKKKEPTFAVLAKDKSEEEMLSLAEQFISDKKDINEVAEAIQQSIILRPDENGIKYLIVAETMVGAEAVEMYKKGIEVLEKDKVRMEESKEQDGNSNNIDFKIASALSSIAELYMTPPLCDLETAEQTCEETLEKAINIDCNNVDALQCLANLRIMRARDQEAIELLDKVVKVIKEKDNEGEFGSLPPYEFRLQTSRLLIELQQFKSAIKPLDTLIKEDDTKAEVWYLLSYCHYNLKKFQNASECANNVLTSADLEADIEEATHELLAKIKDEAGIVEDTTASEQPEGKDDLLDADYETISEEDISDEDNNMKVDEDANME